MSSSNHYENLTSPRCKRVLAALKRRPMTTMEIVKEANVVNPARVICALRYHKINIEALQICTKPAVWQYTYLGEEK